MVREMDGGGSEQEEEKVEEGERKEGAMNINQNADFLPQIQQNKHSHRSGISVPASV